MLVGQHIKIPLNQRSQTVIRNPSPNEKKKKKNLEPHQHVVNVMHCSCCDLK